MRARFRSRARLVGAVIAISAVFGAGLSFLTGREIGSGIVSGVFIASAISALEILLQGPWMETVRRLPVALVFLFRTAAYGATFFLMVHLSVAVVQRSWDPLLHPSRLVTNGTALASFAFALSVNFAIILGRLLGPRILVSLLTGRYHQPREEQRLVLFMDLRGSTRAAETLGDAKFHRFLNRVFWDATDPILESGGEIYRYVGDEIIVTWPVRDAARNAAAVGCMFAVEDALARRRGRYLAEFGIEPRFRGALHTGPLIVGEMGAAKREIVMLGDTMNTTARIESVCRAMDRDYVASAEALDAAFLPAGVHAQGLGPVTLRGKENGIELFALTRENV